MNMKNFNNKGAGTFSVLVIIGFIVVIFFMWPSIGPYLGITPIKTTTVPPTEGVVASGITYPSSITPQSTFGVSFLLQNNLNGKVASDIHLCLDNMGLFTLSSGNRCLTVPSLFAGGVLSESYTLNSPPVSAYGNIPYVQTLGYYINFSYASSSVQSLQFVSSNPSGTIPFPQTNSFDTTAGPLSITSSAQQPVVYGQDAQLNLNLKNVGNGIVIGLVNIVISMNSSLINMTSASNYGFVPTTYANGTVAFSASRYLGQTGLSLILPVVLNSKEESKLSTSGVPYITSNINFHISYAYEEDGFFDIKLLTQ